MKSIQSGSVSIPLDSYDEQSAQVLAGLDDHGKRAVWKQLTAAERERLKVFAPRERPTEVVQ